MPLSRDDLARMRAVAEAATAGPWPETVWVSTDEGGWAAVGPHHEDDDGYADEESPQHERATRDARFLSTFDPPTVRALLDHIEEQARVIAAEQGQPEGAPSEGWAYTFELDHTGWPCVEWRKGEAVVWRGPTAHPDPLRWVWYWSPGNTVGTEAPNARAAMLAADESATRADGVGG